MVQPTVEGGGRASLRLVKDESFPSSEYPDWNGWRKTYELTAIPDDGWVFDHWHIVGVQNVWVDEEHTIQIDGVFFDNPYVEVEEDFTVRNQSDRRWYRTITSITAVFVHSSIVATSRVEPDAAQMAGCTVVAENGSGSITKHGVPGDMAEFKFTATPAAGWRFYGWKVDGIGWYFKRNKSPTFTHQFTTGEVSFEHLAVFKPADGEVLCKKRTNGTKFDIVCRASTGGIFCNS